MGKRIACTQQNKIECVLSRPRRCRHHVIYLFICACHAISYPLSYDAMSFQYVELFSVKIGSISFRCENIWKLLPTYDKRTYARKQIVIMWLKLGKNTEQWNVGKLKHHARNGGIVDSRYFFPNFSRNQKCILFLRKKW